MENALVALGCVLSTRVVCCLLFVVCYLFVCSLSYLVEVVVHAVLPVGHRDRGVDRLQRLLHLQGEGHVVVD